MSLDGKVALVTGSGRNIGRATALELARMGANVIVNSRSNREEAEAVAQEITKMGRSAEVVIADVGIEKQATQMVDQAIAKFNKIDILINNAGIRMSSPISSMSTEEWENVLSVNLHGPFYLCRAVVPHMINQQWGRIINVSGLNAFKGMKDWAHVCASKMGALGLTRSLSVELAESNILVNHIVPGAFDTTPVNSLDLISRVTVEERAKSIPMGRLGFPNEIAKTCAFLCSEGGNFITGQTIHVNGGALAY